MGASKCAIPVGYPIRSQTAWFGLHLQIGEAELLVARRCPDESSTSSDVYIREGPVEEIPKEIEKETNPENLKNRLNQLCGLPSLPFTPKEDGNAVGFQARPSVRDMVSFCFQPQHIVANPFALFYRSDTHEHRERLKVIFPLVLGAISNEHLSLRHELRELTNELRRLELQIRGIQDSNKEWEGQVEGLFHKAAEYGLVNDRKTNNWDLERFVTVLRDIPDSIRANPVPLIEEGASAIAVERLGLLREQEASLSSELGVQRNHLSKTTALARSVDSFESTAAKNEGRIRSVGWFADKIKGENKCPMCGAADDEVKMQLESLVKDIQEFSNVASVARETPAVLDSEISETKRLIARLEQRLNSVRTERQEIESQTEELAQRRQELGACVWIVGGKFGIISGAG